MESMELILVLQENQLNYTFFCRKAPIDMVRVYYQAYNGVC